MSNPISNPRVLRTSRELSDRVEQDFHKRGDPFRRRLGWLSLVGFLLVVGWIALAAARGQRTIYQAGSVAPAHRFIENDCQACHTHWAPVTRLVPTFSGASSTRSINEASCQKCHPGGPHFEGQSPAHEGMSCAACHREHRGDPTLTFTANDRCIACHESLSSHLDKARSSHPEVLRRVRPDSSEYLRMTEGAEGRSPTADSITSFSVDHPEFAALARPDKAKLRFNHAAHLQSEYDKSGKLVKGVINEKGELEDLSTNCAECHEPDAEKRYMKPIRYEQHCQRCHPLLFDNERLRGEVVPHGLTSTLLRGFLTERYTARALKQGVDERKPAPHPLPWLRESDSSLPQKTQTEVNEAVATAEEQLTGEVARAQGASRDQAAEVSERVFGPHRSNGCALCHVVSRKAAGANAAEPRGYGPDWEIEPPAIPDRWMAASRFSHDSHRSWGCTDCHANYATDPPTPVAASCATSDVLMPSVAVCRNCHSPMPPAGSKLKAASQRGGVASGCVDCHKYHDRTNEKLDGSIRKFPTKSASVGRVLDLFATAESR
jgi:hypothetical protein